MSATVQELMDLLLLDVPEAQARRDGFLDVISQNTRENTINDIYQYFLTAERSSSLGAQLMDSLLELVKAGYRELGVIKELDFQDYEVHREYPSKNGGRIDLVIKETDGSSVIIIEVKVHHWLANDLKDYWNTFREFDEKNKGAVVLTLEAANNAAESSENFLNITHEQWLNHARAKGIPHDLPIEQIIYFNDFVDNMNQLTRSKMVTENVLFYLNHADKINKAIETKNQTYKYLYDQLLSVASYFDWVLHGKTNEWRHLVDKQNKATAYYAVLPETILNQKGSVKVKLELKPKAIPYKEQIWTLINGEVVEHGLTRGSDGSPYYQHIAYKTFKIEPEEFSNMTKILTDGIKNDLEPVRKKIMAFLEKQDAHCED